MCLRTSILVFVLLQMCSAAVLNETCASDNECAVAGSACKPNSCLGYVCMCDVGFRTNENEAKCMNVGLIGGQCSRDTDCLPFFSRCSSGQCECTSNRRPTSDNFSCLPFDSSIKRHGENCTTSQECARFTTCVNGICTCSDGLMPWTEEERWLLFPGSTVFDCRPPELSSEICNGTNITFPAASPTTAVMLNETCTSNDDCEVAGSACKPNSCLGYVCMCDVGFRTNENGTKCMNVSLIGGQCSGDTDCLPFFSRCSSGQCECTSNRRPTGDNFFCLPSDSSIKRYGENCTTSQECATFTTCVNGVCTCSDGLMPWTEEERWLLFPGSVIIDCRLPGLSNEICNGTNITAGSPTTGVRTSSSTRDKPTTKVPEQARTDQATGIERIVIPIFVAVLLFLAIVVVVIVMWYRLRRRQSHLVDDSSNSNEDNYRVRMSQSSEMKLSGFQGQ